MGERAIGRLEFSRLVSPARLEVANHTEGERRGSGHQLHLHEDKDERKEAARHRLETTRELRRISCATAVSATRTRAGRTKEPEAGRRPR